MKKVYFFVCIGRSFFYVGGDLQAAIDWTRKLEQGRRHAGIVRPVANLMPVQIGYVAI
jgi:hypothetical protein